MKSYTMIICIILSISKIYSQSTEIISERVISKSSLMGAYCPNSLDDEIGPGGFDFNGGVKFTQNHTFRIEVNPNNSILYLDVEFSFIGTNHPDVYVKGKRSLKLFMVDDPEESIIGFRQTRPTSQGYTRWLTQNSGMSTWTDTGDTGIFCEDDNTPDILGVQGVGIFDIFISLDIQGDTGGSDISTDRDCSCDTRVLKIYWQNNIQVAIAPDIDRDGKQDILYIDELAVDDNTSETQEMNTLCVSGNPPPLFNIASNPHNGDCLRLYGSIDVIIGNRQTNSVYETSSSSMSLVNWFSGNTVKDFNKRSLWNVPFSKVCYNVPKDDIENRNVVLKLKPNKLKGCHKGCDLCSDYGCDVKYGESELITLNNFVKVGSRNQMATKLIMNSGIGDPNNHYLEVPLQIEY